MTQSCQHLVYGLKYNDDGVAFKMGRRQGGPSRTGSREGAYLNQYVTDEQRGCRPIFDATLRATAGWLLFGVARFLRPPRRIILVAPPGAAQAEALLAGRALKNSQLTRGDVIIICETVH
jgi:hypothetical protein